MRCFPPRAARRLRAFRRAVERALPGNVERVVLFGSRARGEARRGSDYDIAVFVREGAERTAVHYMVSDSAYPYVLAASDLRPIVLPADYLSGRSELAEDIRRESVLVPGPE